MRGLTITLLPMIAAASLVLWGGERLARRETQTRIPADRVRLLDFSAALQQELNRIDQLYAGHLDTLAGRSLSGDQELVSKHCQEIAAVRQCHVFRKKEHPVPIVGSSPRRDEKLPELVLEDGKRPFNPEQAVVLPKDLGLREGADRMGWILAPDRVHRIYWQRLNPDQLVAFVIDFVEVHERMKRHLEEWMDTPFAPLREAGEFVSIRGPDQLEVTGTPAATRGPAALVLPYRTHLGDWQIEAWDRIRIVKGHDATTIAVAIGISGILVLLGIFLCIQQNRAIRLAEERVSFVNRVSHELGSPLTNVLLNLELATDALRTRPSEADHRLRLVGEEVRRLGRLVSNVLTFSRSERDSLQLHAVPCVPDEVIASMLDQFQPSLDRRGIQVEWHRNAPGSVVLDPDALAQIVGNLISNVEKYAAGGAWMGVDSRWENERLRIRVSDRGPGIPTHKRRKVFNAFERVNQSVSEGASGTGLGLAIARDLARRMKGDLVLLELSTGTAFECELPAPPHLVAIHSTPSAA